MPNPTVYIETTKMRQTCRAAGYEPPIICTPYELRETGHDRPHR